MNARERQRLTDKMTELLSSLGGVVRHKITEHSYEWLVPSANGWLDVHFYGVTTSRDVPWMSCSFRKWGETHKALGFRHWKNNLDGRKEWDAKKFLEQAETHLEWLGCSNSEVDTFCRLAGL